MVIKKSLKYLSNFWRSFEMALINRKIELKFKSKKHCVVTSLEKIKEMRLRFSHGSIMVF